MLFKVKITYYAYDGSSYVYRRGYRPGEDFEKMESLRGMADAALQCGRADAWCEEHLSPEDITVATVHGIGEEGRVLCEYPCGDEGYREVIYARKSK